MLYLLTNPHTKLSGCYEIGSKQFERETGYNTDTISRLIDRMENVHNVIRYCKPTKEVLILNWNKYNWCGNSPKVLQAVKKEAESIKHEPFKDFILKKIENPDYQFCGHPGMSSSLKALYDNGDLGVKTGKGYYNYTQKPRMQILKEADEKLIKAIKLVEELDADPLYDVEDRK